MMFQTRCAGCDAPGVAVCTTCRFALLGPRPPGRCADGIHAALPFAGVARDVVLGLKYRNRRQSPGTWPASWSTPRPERRRDDDRRRHLGTDERGASAGAWLRPGRAPRPRRRPPARCAVPPAALSVRRRAHPDGPVPPERLAGPAFRRSKVGRRLDRAPRRRRRHHRRHAGSARRALVLPAPPGRAPCRRRHSGRRASDPRPLPVHAAAGGASRPDLSTAADRRR